MNPSPVVSYHNTLKPPPMFVAQVFYNGMTLPGKRSSPKGWWWTSGICFVIFLIIMSMDISDDESYEDCQSNAFTAEEIDRCDMVGQQGSGLFAVFGTMSCCFSVIAGLIALSVGSKKQTVIVQQMPQMYAAQPVIQQVIQQPVQQAPRGQMPIQQPPPVPARPQVPERSSAQSNQGLAQQAKNLEMARDFEGAADMFQKAGLFAEAGRVRQKFLEKEDKPVVQIGQVGNSVVQDSVIMAGAAQSNVCQSCSSSIQPDWKFCPSCNTPI